MTGHFVHPKALCESETVGEGTRVFAFAHILSGARIGRDCNIGDHTFIENDVIVGDRVTINCGVQLWDGVRLEDDVVVGPNATFTNDPSPGSKHRLSAPVHTVVARGASIGANATILPGRRIGERALVGAGAVVTRSVPRNAIVRGNPARIAGYVDAVKAPSAAPDRRESRSVKEGSAPTSVGGVTFHRLPVVEDMRGDLSVGEFSRTIPFVPRRYFFVFNVPSREVRGEHAHVKCEQFLICVNGSVSIVVDDGKNREEFLLDSRNLGLHIPPMTWGVQYRYSPDAVLLVFASEFYDDQDYIRDYGEFLARKASTG
ncbi:MAG: WxcM-like domain-containing protein [Acidobacteriota bacterium]|nr:WxcM-like domain-containing protein [Acidobacteriota bacterium]